MRAALTALSLAALVLTGGCASTAVSSGSAAVAAPAPVPTPGVPSGDRFLFGSGEAAALSNQAYNQLVVYLRARARDRLDKVPVRSVVLTPGASFAHVTFDDCGQKPLAVVFDIDETSVFNLGYEADATQRGLSYDPARWDRWEATGTDAVAPLPGAVSAMAQARAMGVTVIFNSNRTTTHADQTATMLDHAGLGPAVLGKTLFLREPAASGAKDARRAQIAAQYCVVAMAGDQLGDFTDLFNAPGMTPVQRRAAANGDPIASLWGAGWFILPNPVYGTGLAGGFDDVFPADKRWTDPGPAPSTAP